MGAPRCGLIGAGRRPSCAPRAPCPTHRLRRARSVTIETVRLLQVPHMNEYAGPGKMLVNSHRLTSEALREHVTYRNLKGPSPSAGRPLAACGSNYQLRPH